MNPIFGHPAWCNEIGCDRDAYTPVHSFWLVYACRPDANASIVLYPHRRESDIVVNVTGTLYDTYTGPEIDGISFIFYSNSVRTTTTATTATTTTTLILIRNTRSTSHVYTHTHYYNIYDYNTRVRENVNLFFVYFSFPPAYSVCRCHKTLFLYIVV